MLTDLAADVRAATPSAAAEVATPDRATLRESLLQATADLQFEFGSQLEERKSIVTQLGMRLKVIGAGWHDSV